MGNHLLCVKVFVIEVDQWKHGQYETMKFEKLRQLLLLKLSGTMQQYHETKLNWIILSVIHVMISVATEQQIHRYVRYVESEK